MATNSFLKTQKETIDNLSFADSYEKLYHECTEGVPLPSNDVLRKIIELTRGIIFPGYYGKSNVHVDTLKYSIGVDIEELYSLLVTQIQAGLSFSRFDEWSAEFASYNQYTLINEMLRLAEDRTEKFISVLPELRRVLATDVVAAFNGDPAARNYGEIISCYPVIKVLTVFRMAHEL